MRQIILLGDPGTKRADYFQRAAAQAGVPFCLWGWDSRRRTGFSCFSELLGDSFVKIDPPLWGSSHLDELPVYVSGYQRDLMRLAGLSETCGLSFLNHPSAIMDVLDKKGCKERLLQAGIPVTEPLGAMSGDTERLIGQMREERVFQVFIKPRYGSGAAGTAAFRYCPGNGQAVLYTCAALDPQTGRLVNTKRLRRYVQREGIFPLLDRILGADHVVERWYPKDGCGGYSYDLRAVVQDGRIDFLLARLSKGPITNLHLGARPLSVEALGLSADVLESITELCKKAMDCYPGLRSAGIDLLLEKGSRRPRVIEMNGQGDLIYQDIYQENRIYRHQVEMMGGDR